MTKEEIKTVVELFISWNGEEDPIDTSNLNSAVDYINECLSPSLPSNLDEAAKEYLKQYNESEFGNGGDDWDDDILITFKAGAEWMQKQEEEYSPWLSINALEEASISFGEQAEMYGIGGQSFSEDMAVAFTRGAEWMAEQWCNIDSYQKQARTFLLEKFQNMPMFELVKYCTLGLNEEAGEVAGKIKKSIRDADGEIDEGRIDAIVKEMGDVLWYLAIMAYSLGLPLSHIAQKNIEKLSDRMNRGKIRGEGDER